MKEKEWPSFYPESLKPISWCIDSEVAGPNGYWNKFIGEEQRESNLFVKNVIESIFVKQGIENIEMYDSYIDWIVKHFTFYMSADEGEFKISLKKDKKTKKPLFTKEEHYKVAKDELGFDKKQADEMIKFILKETKSFYDHCE